LFVQGLLLSVVFILTWTLSSCTRFYSNRAALQNFFDEVLGQSYPLESAEVVIGRDRGWSIQIEAPGVSRRHARCCSRGDAYLLEDLGSSNGTFLNGQRLTSPVALENGDRIGLGLSVQLEYQVEQPAVQETMLEGIAPVSPSLAGTLLEDLLWKARLWKALPWPVRLSGRGLPAGWGRP
jgi:hypothetical protein